MPCRDPNPEYMRGYNNGQKSNAQHHPDDVVKIKELTQRILYLEAALCAVFTELDKEFKLETIINRASKNGDINLTSFWASHKKTDLARLNNSLNQNYSEHELEIIKEILNNN